MASKAAMQEAYVVNTTREEYHKRINTIYLLHKPEKCQLLDKIMNKYSTNEYHELYLRICKKYGVDPLPEFHARFSDDHDSRGIIEALDNRDKNRPLSLIEAANAIPLDRTELRRSTRREMWRLTETAGVGGRVDENDAHTMISAFFETNNYAFDLDRAVSLAFKTVVDSIDDQAIPYGYFRRFLSVLKLYFNVRTHVGEDEANPTVDKETFVAAIQYLKQCGMEFEHDFSSDVYHDQALDMVGELTLNSYLVFANSEMNRMEDDFPVRDLVEVCDILPLMKIPEERVIREKMFKDADPDGSGEVTLPEAQNAIVRFLGKEFEELKIVVKMAFEIASALSSFGEEEVEDGGHTITFIELRMFLLTIRRYIDLWYIHDECDLDQDGMVDIEEFNIAIPLLEAWGIHIKDPNDEFLKIDVDHNGEIEFEEFAMWALTKSRDMDADDFDGLTTSDAFENMLRNSAFKSFAKDRGNLFKRLDVEGTQRIALPSLIKGCKRCGIALTKKDAKKVMKVFSKTGEISFRNWAKIVPKDCDERTLALIVNDIKNDVLKPGQHWEQREPTPDDFDKETAEQIQHGLEHLEAHERAKGRPVDPEIRIRQKQEKEKALEKAKEVVLEKRNAALLKRGMECVPPESKLTDNGEKQFAFVASGLDLKVNPMDKASLSFYEGEPGIQPNEDGTIPLFTDQVFTDVFSLVDNDNNGSITLKEFVQSVRDPEIKAQLAEALGGDFFSMDMFQKVDVDKDGSLSLEEFQKWGRTTLVREVEVQGEGADVDEGSSPEIEFISEREHTPDIEIYSIDDLPKEIKEVSAIPSDRGMFLSDDMQMVLFSDFEEQFMEFDEPQLSFYELSEEAEELNQGGEPVPMEDVFDFEEEDFDEDFSDDDQKREPVTEWANEKIVTHTRKPGTDAKSNYERGSLKRRQKPGESPRIKPAKRKEIVLRKDDGPERKDKRNPKAGEGAASVVEPELSESTDSPDKKRKKKRDPSKPTESMQLSPVMVAKLNPDFVKFIKMREGSPPPVENLTLKDMITIEQEASVPESHDGPDPDSSIHLVNSDLNEQLSGFDFSGLSQYEQPKEDVGASGISNQIPEVKESPEKKLDEGNMPEALEESINDEETEHMKAESLNAETSGKPNRKRDPRVDAPVKRKKRDPRVDAAPLVKRKKRDPREDAPVKKKRDPREDAPVKEKRDPREDAPVKGKRDPREDAAKRDPREAAPKRKKRDPRVDAPPRKPIIFIPFRDPSPERDDQVEGEALLTEIRETDSPESKDCITEASLMDVVDNLEERAEALDRGAMSYYERQAMKAKLGSFLDMMSDEDEEENKEEATVEIKIDEVEVQARKEENVHDRSISSVFKGYFGDDFIAQREESPPPPLMEYSSSDLEPLVEREIGDPIVQTNEPMENTLPTMECLISDQLKELEGGDWSGYDSIVPNVEEDEDSDCTWYCTILPTLVRKEMRMDSQKVIVIPIGTEVCAVQQIRKRVRITKPVEGWCSIKLNSGDVLLKERDEVEAESEIQNTVEEGEDLKAEDIESDTKPKRSPGEYSKKREPSEADLSNVESNENDKRKPKEIEPKRDPQENNRDKVEFIPVREDSPEPALIFSSDELDSPPPRELDVLELPNRETYDEKLHGIMDDYYIPILVSTIDIGGKSCYEEIADSTEKAIASFNTGVFGSSPLSTLGINIEPEEEEEIMPDDPHETYFIEIRESSPEPSDRYDSGDLQNIEVRDVEVPESKAIMMDSKEESLMKFGKQILQQSVDFELQDLSEYETQYASPLQKEDLGSDDDDSLSESEESDRENFWSLPQGSRKLPDFIIVISDLSNISKFITLRDASPEPPPIYSVSDLTPTSTRDTDVPESRPCGVNDSEDHSFAKLDDNSIPQQLADLEAMNLSVYEPNADDLESEFNENKALPPKELGSLPQELAALIESFGTEDLDYLSKKFPEPVGFFSRVEQESITDELVREYFTLPTGEENGALVEKIMDKMRQIIKNTNLFEVAQKCDDVDEYRFINYRETSPTPAMYDSSDLAPLLVRDVEVPESRCSMKHISKEEESSMLPCMVEDDILPSLAALDAMDSSFYEPEVELLSDDGSQANVEMGSELGSLPQEFVALLTKFDSKCIDRLCEDFPRPMNFLSKSPTADSVRDYFTLPDGTEDGTTLKEIIKNMHRIIGDMEVEDSNLKEEFHRKVFIGARDVSPEPIDDYYCSDLEPSDIREVEVPESKNSTEPRGTESNEFGTDSFSNGGDELLLKRLQDLDSTDVSGYETTSNADNEETTAGEDKSEAGKNVEPEFGGIVHSGKKFIAVREGSPEPELYSVDDLESTPIQEAVTLTSRPSITNNDSLRGLNDPSLISRLLALDNEPLDDREDKEFAEAPRGNSEGDANRKVSNHGLIPNRDDSPEPEDLYSSLSLKQPLREPGVPTSQNSVTDRDLPFMNSKLKDTETEISALIPFRGQSPEPPDRYIPRSYTPPRTKAILLGNFKLSDIDRHGSLDLGDLSSYDVEPTADDLLDDKDEILEDKDVNLLPFESSVTADEKYEFIPIRAPSPEPALQYSSSELGVDVRGTKVPPVRSVRTLKNCVIEVMRLETLKNNFAWMNEESESIMFDLSAQMSDTEYAEVISAEPISFDDSQDFNFSIDDSHCNEESQSKDQESADLDSELIEEMSDSEVIPENWLPLPTMTLAENMELPRQSTPEVQVYSSGEFLQERFIDAPPSSKKTVAINEALHRNRVKVIQHKDHHDTMDDFLGEDSASIKDEDLIPSKIHFIVAADRCAFNETSLVSRHKDNGDESSTLGFSDDDSEDTSIFTDEGSDSDSIDGGNGPGGEVLPSHSRGKKHVSMQEVVIAKDAQGVDPDLTYLLRLPELADMMDTPILRQQTPEAPLYSVKDIGTIEEHERQQRESQYVGVRYERSKEPQLPFAGFHPRSPSKSIQFDIHTRDEPFVPQHSHHANSIPTHEPKRGDSPDVIHDLSPKEIQFQNFIRHVPRKTVRYAHHHFTNDYNNRLLETECPRDDMEVRTFRSRSPEDPDLPPSKRAIRPTRQTHRLRLIRKAYNYHETLRIRHTIMEDMMHYPERKETPVSKQLVHNPRYIPEPRKERSLPHSDFALKPPSNGVEPPEHKQPLGPIFDNSPETNAPSLDILQPTKASQELDDIMQLIGKQSKKRYRPEREKPSVFRQKRKKEKERERRREKNRKKKRKEDPGLAVAEEPRRPRKRQKQAASFDETDVSKVVETSFQVKRRSTFDSTRSGKEYEHRWNISLKYFTKEHDQLHKTSEKKKRFDFKTFYDELRTKHGSLFDELFE